MRKEIDRLERVSRLAICPEPAAVNTAASPRIHELLSLLSEINGFYAFDSALHVLPACGHTQYAGHHIGLNPWNAGRTWKSWYGGAVDPYFCFAEDVFGRQFAIVDDVIVRLDPERVTSTFVAGTIEEWSMRMLTDRELLSDREIARKWQRQVRPLRAGERLLPRTPFMFGGEYAVENLSAVEAVSGMRMRGSVYRRVLDLPSHVRRWLLTTAGSSGRFGDPAE